MYIIIFISIYFINLYSTRVEYKLLKSQSLMARFIGKFYFLAT